jgi:hypothetical protein
MPETAAERAWKADPHGFNAAPDDRYDAHDAFIAGYEAGQRATDFDATDGPLEPFSLNDGLNAIAKLRASQREQEALITALQEVSRVAERTNPQLPKRVDEMSPEEYAIFVLLAEYAGAFLHVRKVVADAFFAVRFAESTK